MKHVLLATPQLAVAVRRYPPGERQPLHTDLHSRISFVLRGAYREDTPHQSAVIAPGEVLIKSRRAEHEDAFSGDGATLAAIEFLDGDSFDAAVEERFWRRRTDGFALRHIIAVLEAALAGDGGRVAAITHDLLADSASADQPVRAQAPTWIKHLKSALEHASLAEVDVAAHARAAGVHPVHASRLFRRCFGTSVSEHAQAQSVRRAMTDLAEPGALLSDVALAAGFYDQSHMNRAFQRVTGRTPGAHRAALSAAAG
jgi:AraC family transcriptional regulator